MAQHLALRQSACQHGMHRLHIEQPLAGEGAFAKKILVYLGAGCAVGIDAALSRKQPVVQRDVLGCGQRRGHARLQDAIATHHAASVCGEMRLVVRVRCHAYQFAQATRWQLRVAVQRDDVLCIGRHAGFGAQIQKSGRGALRQRRYQQFKFSPLAFPANPALFALAESALAMQQNKAWRSAIRHRLRRVVRVFHVERTDSLSRAGQQRIVGCHSRRVGVAPIR